MATESVRKEATKRSAKKKLDAKVIGSIDNSVEDVLECIKEGREIFFKDGSTEFLKLPEDVVRDLSIASKERYRLAQNITAGNDVVGAIQDGKRGWAKDYQVRPGSFTDNTTVFGKDPTMDYVLSTPIKMTNKVARGWETDHDPNVHMLVKESGTLKTVGGEKNPELILMSRPKSIGIAEKKARAEKSNRLMSRTKEQFVDKANRLGVVASID